MGLDMYLTGTRYFCNPGRTRGERKAELIDLGYWRKHPDMHGYIVKSFAGGVDECQEIDLSADHLRKVIAAILADALPKTTGFFFGVSDGTEKAEDLQIFREALAWIEADDAIAWRSIAYRASW